MCYVLDRFVIPNLILNQQQLFPGVIPQEGRERAKGWDKRPADRRKQVFTTRLPPKNGRRPSPQQATSHARTAASIVATALRP